MDFVIVPILLFFAYRLKYSYDILNSNFNILLDKLLVYHLLMSIIFYTYVNKYGGDAQIYWYGVKDIDFQTLFEVMTLKNYEPTTIIWLINYIPSNVLNLSFFSGCILYSILGYWGLLYIIVTLKERFPLVYQLKKIKYLGVSIFPTILFLPNLHFWSAGVGKDTLIFFSVCVFFYAVSNLKKRWWYLFISIAICYPIRPHILLFLLTGFASSYIIKSNLLLYQKLFIVLLSAIVFLPLLNNVLEFANIEEATLESFNKFGEQKSGLLNADSGSGIDNINLPYALQVLTFLYRPLFFDAHNVLSILASIENLIWIFLTIIWLNNNPIKLFKNNHYIVFSAFLYWIIGAFAFAPVLGNLGIIIRERNMFLPGFIIFILSGFYNKKRIRHLELYSLKRRKR